MTRTTSLLLACIGLGAATSPALADEEETRPGLEALEVFRTGASDRNPVKNRFFLKSKRFELTPSVGLVPNNPFARRFTVSLGFGYHFSETLAIAGMFSFAPDLREGDLKGLTDVLLERATDDDFQQPVDKVTLSANLGVQWAPFYGKINLLGETVVNFDFYGFLGLGFVVQNEYFATENPEATTLSDFVILSTPQTEVRIAPTVAVGANFFVSQMVALRLDARFALFPDDKPVYNIEEPETGSRLVTMFTASAGISIFLPKMKPRITDF
jgi:outer membrane beta-barrel protein